MLISRRAVIHWRKTATAQACQLNMNNAARAPQWRSPKAMLLVQFIFCRSVLSRRSVLTNASRGSSLQCFRRSIIRVLSNCAFMARVASTTNLPIPMRHWREESLRENVAAWHPGVPTGGAERCAYRLLQLDVYFDRTGRSVRLTC
jgi:hypothetical protein